MDSSSCNDRPVGARINNIIHIRRVYSHPASYCIDRYYCKTYNRKKTLKGESNEKRHQN